MGTISSLLPQLSTLPSLTTMMDNSFLMGNQDKAFLFLPVNLLKLLHQHGKAPQIDSGLRFIEDAYFMILRHHRGNFHSFSFSAGQRGVHLPVQIFLRAQADAEGHQPGTGRLQPKRP